MFEKPINNPFDKQDASQKPMIYKYTLNKEEIPTPFQGEFYDPSNGLSLLLTRELLGPNCSKAEVKVIGFRVGQLPSFVAVKTFKMVPGKELIDLKDGELGMMRPTFDLKNVTLVSNLSEMFQQNNGGTSSITSSPDVEAMGFLMGDDI